MRFLKMTLIPAVLLALLITMPAVAPCDNIITGCSQGTVENHSQTFPRQAIGNYPDKILNWEIALAKGSYTITVSSYYDFIPYIYTKKNGKYTYSGIPMTATSRRVNGNQTIYERVFTANHSQAMGQNWWLLQIKPKPQFQNTNHGINLKIAHTSCPKPTVSGCRCPDGSYESTSHTWGQTTCWKNGKQVNMICK